MSDYNPISIFLNNEIIEEKKQVVKTNKVKTSKQSILDAKKEIERYKQKASQDKNIKKNQKIIVGFQQENILHAEKRNYNNILKLSLPPKYRDDFMELIKIKNKQEKRIVKKEEVLLDIIEFFFKNHNIEELYK